MLHRIPYVCMRVHGRSRPESRPSVIQPFLTDFCHYESSRWTVHVRTFVKATCYLESRSHLITYWPVALHRSFQRHQNHSIISAELRELNITLDVTIRLPETGFSFLLYVTLQPVFFISVLMCRNMFRKTSRKYTVLCLILVVTVMESVWSPN